MPREDDTVFLDEQSLEKHASRAQQQVIYPNNKARKYRDFLIQKIPYFLTIIATFIIILYEINR